MSADPTPATQPWYSSFPFGKIILGGLFFFAFYPGIWEPDVDLDPSWRMMAGHVLKNGLQFGKEFIFTTGPLAFLNVQTYSGHFTSLITIWSVLMSAGTAIFLLRLLPRFGLTQQVLLTIFFLTVIPGNIDQLYSSVLLLAGVALVSARKLSLKHVIFVALVMAIFSLIKFTLALLALTVVVAVWIYGIANKQYENPKRVTLAYAASLILLWIVCRQSPLNLPLYFLNSLEISLGYGETMGIPTPPVALSLALIVIFGLACYTAAAIYGSSQRSYALCRGLILAAATFLTWKHGFVRADGHMQHFFVFAIMASLAFPYLLGETVRYRGGQFASVLVAGATALIAMHFLFPYVTTALLPTFNDNVRRRYTEFEAGRADQLRLDHYWETAAKKYRLDHVPAAVKDETVDVLSHFQGVALLNGLNYAPRPIPQSYSAYTPRLAALNAAHYDSEKAPQWVLQRVRTIDDRFPTLDDAQLNPALIRNYTYKFQDGPYLVWQRNRPENRFTSFVPTAGETKFVTIDEVIPLNQLVDQTVWARIDLKPSLLGRVRSFLYKPVVPLLEVTDTTGRTHAYRFLPKLAAKGFILNPLLRDEFDWLRYLGRHKNARVVTLRVIVPPEDRKFFSGKFSYAFDVFPQLPQANDRKDEQLLAEFGGFRNLPISFASPNPLGPTHVGGTPAVLIHAPSEMVFNINAEATEFRAKYGIADSAYLGDAKLGGVGVAVLLKTPAGTRKLFDRWLDPLNVVGDRGLHELKLDLAKLGPGQLILSNYIKDSNAWAWTAWRDVEILPASITSEKGELMMTGSNHILTRFGNFNVLPIGLRTGTSLIAVSVDGVSMIQAHAPSEMAFTIPPGAKRAVGRFAFQEGTFTNGAATDGAEFSVLWKFGADERVLFKRYLDPVANPEDRGVQKFDVSFAELPNAGTLLLRIDTGPHNVASWDWTCWSDVNIGDPAPLPDVPRRGDGLGLDGTNEIPKNFPEKIFRDAGFKTLPAQVGALVPLGPSLVGDLAALQVHPPSDMVIPLDKTPKRVTAKYGLQTQAAMQTDGVEYIAEWHSPTGERKLLFRRLLRPVTDLNDAKPQTLDISLEGLSGGELHLRIEAGPANNTAFDWAAWQGLEVEGALQPAMPAGVPFTLTSPPAARVAHKPRLTPELMQRYQFSHPPVLWDDKHPPAESLIDKIPVLQFHAPNSFMIPLPVGAKTLTGKIGMPEGAYNSPTPTDGADWVVKWVGTDGTTVELKRLHLSPNENMADIGLHSFEVDLKDLTAGDLLFLTEPGPKGYPTSDWTCWQGIQIK